MKKIVMTFCLATALTTSLTGCGAYILSQLLDDDDDPIQHQAPTENKKSVDCSLEDPNKLPEDAFVQKNALEMTTISQKYIYQNCSGQETSRGTYKVKDDNTNIDLVAQKTTQEIKKFSIYNRSTCRGWKDMLGGPYGEDGSLVHMKVGLNSGFLENNLKVREGLNVISYVFRGDCKNGADTCEDSDRLVIEEGFLSLQVHHTATDLPDTKIVKKDAQGKDCQ